MAGARFQVYVDTVPDVLFPIILLGFSSMGTWTEGAKVAERCRFHHEIKYLLRDSNLPAKRGAAGLLAGKLFGPTQNQCWKAK